MAKRRRAASHLSPLLLLAAVSQAQAQVTIDVAKISCEQFIYYKITDPQHIAIWLSGYYQARAASTLVDTQALNASAEKLKDHCRINLQQPVMQAAETLFGAGKK
jgi:acid stress chaperone HdeB